MVDFQIMEHGTESPGLTVLVATDQQDGMAATLDSYRKHLDSLDRPYELLAIVNGAHAGQVADLGKLSSGWPELTVIGQRPWVGEDAALATGLRRGRGDLVLLLPGWAQIDPADIPALFTALGDHDMVSAARTEQAAGGWQGFRKSVFARTLNRLFGTSPSDPFCRARLVRRDTLESVTSFGVRQHFLPIIAAQRGHSVTEAHVRAASADEGPNARYVFKPLGHMRAMLDAVALYVVLKFLRRPLRFFGAIGLPIFLLGAILTTVMVMRRLFGDTALADRPALIFAVMMVVLGIQILAIGLVGEIIIFAGARRLKQYDVAEIITTGRRPDRTADPDTTQDTEPGPDLSGPVRNAAG